MIVATKTYSGIESSALSEPYDAAIDQGIGDWEVSSDRLLALGASTCIVLAAHNIVTSKGLLGHFSSIATDENTELYNNRTEFSEALEAIKSLGHLGHTAVWLGGGSPFYLDTDPSRDQVAVDRAYAETQIEGLVAEGLNRDNLTVRWSDPERSIDVELDCREYALIVHDHPDFSSAFLLGNQGLANLIKGRTES